jgi:hypothetical protein
MVACFPLDGRGRRSSSLSGLETALVVAISLFTPICISFYFAMKRTREEIAANGGVRPRTGARAAAGAATPKTGTPAAKKAVKKVS